LGGGAFAQDPGTPSPAVLMKEGVDAFNNGSFKDAALKWENALELFDKAGEDQEQVDVLTRLAQAYQHLGYYDRATERLEWAEKLANDRLRDDTQLALIRAKLANNYVTTRDKKKAEKSFENAEESFDGALKAARNTNNPALTATILNDKGNLHVRRAEFDKRASQEEYGKAFDDYEESMTLATKAGNNELAATAQTNAAAALIRIMDYGKAKEFLDEASVKSQSLGRSHHKAYILINIGLGYRRLRSDLPESTDVLRDLAHSRFEEAISAAEALGDLRALSYALGYQGTLYEDEKQTNKALDLTRKAAFTAQQARVPESLYRWQWQAGRLLKAENDIKGAATAYQNAVKTHRSIRHALPIDYVDIFEDRDPKESFRESSGRVYFELVELLLDPKTPFIKGLGGEQKVLAAARETVEGFKVAELRDYFRDPCVDRAESRIEKIESASETATIIYPIILSDRTEVLVTFPAKAKSNDNSNKEPEFFRFQVNISSDELRKKVTEFRKTLEERTTWYYRDHAKELYEWFIVPLEKEIAQRNIKKIDTLVFVPDGVLRTIPMSALHDGNKFLIERYAVAITPSVKLTAPKAIKREDAKMLLMGLTKGDEDFEPLDYVKKELEDIRSLYSDTQLLVDESFVAANVEEELKKAFNLVHIATHGEFEGDAESTFLLTFKGKLYMDKLEEYVTRFRYRDNPLELITLSACQTAAGDERAALGLAGIAIKASARSALATLWFINDQSSSELVREFYRQLQDPTVSRAKALQKAQIELVNQKRYEHPSYWSPFLLINNWL
jgi:CHAT domain-containing protein